MRPELWSVRIDLAAPHHHRQHIATLNEPDQRSEKLTTPDQHSLHLTKRQLSTQPKPPFHPSPSRSNLARSATTTTPN